MRTQHPSPESWIQSKDLGLVAAAIQAGALSGQELAGEAVKVVRHFRPPENHQILVKPVFVK